MHLTCERFRDHHLFNTPTSTIPFSCHCQIFATYHPHHFKYNLFSLILSNCFPRCLFLLAVKSYWIRIKHTVTVERNLTGWLKSSQMCCSHIKNTQDDIWAAQLGVFFWSSELRELQGDDCEMNHEAKLPIFWCSMLDLLFPTTEVFSLHVGDMSDKAASSWGENCRLQVSS